MLDVDLWIFLRRFMESWLSALREMRKIAAERNLMFDYSRKEQFTHWFLSLLRRVRNK